MQFAANSTVLAFLVLSITMAHALPRSAESEATHLSLDSRAVRYQHLDERRRTCYKDASALQTFEGNEFQTNVISPLLSKSAQSDGIQYDGFSATQNTGNRGILPKSGDKYLVNGLGHDLLSTTPCMKVGQLSGIDYFDLHSFYFGCSLVTTDLISLGGIFPNVPTPCTVSLKGYYRGRLIGEQQFDFRPGSSSSLGERAQLHAGQCHSHFQGVDKVEFRTDNPTLKALTLDNISYQPARCDSDQAPARFSSRTMKRGDK